MSTDAFDMETLLKRAFTPVDPPERLSLRLETTLQSLTDASLDELEGWELSAMRDPRNWVRPVVATAVGASAGTALVVLRVRAGQKKKLQQQSRNPAVQVRKTADAAAAEVRKLLQR
ncbi:MAG: hypothetical protein JHC95_04460 [Solirubrobacteraceae bacterium]|nr:hypothetical protein [Solirubrobacteraceae bacterium]